MTRRHHRRHARVVYRMQLWHACAKKGAPDRRGEYATIRFDQDTSPEVQQAQAAPEIQVFKVVRDMLQDARKFALEMAQAQIQMAQQASGTSLYGLQMVEEMARRKSELADVAAAIRMQPSADDVNRRIESVMSRLEKPLAVLAHSMGPTVQQWAQGAAQAAQAPTPPPTPPTAESRAAQAKAQAFFGGLSPDQRDAIRDALGLEKFGAVVEVIQGPAEQWASEAQHLKGTLFPHLGDLQTILTPQQLAELMAVS